MRYSTSHKDQTRKRIIDTASRLFKERGIDATGVALVMKEADLTNGAFYAHFDSKEELVRQVIVDQLQLKTRTFWDVPGDATDLSTLVDAYLSPEHVRNFADGCPSAALLDEIGRRSTLTKKAYSDNLLEFTTSFQKRFPDLSPEAVRSQAFALYGLLVGTVQLARATTDKAVSDQILASGRTAARALLATTEELIS